MKILLPFLVISFLLFISCQNEVVVNEEIVEDNAVETNTLETDGVSFSKEIQPLLDHDCISCHEYLEKNVSYVMLTTNNSTSVGSAKYIDTLNPEESYFYLKLKDEPACGSSMGGEWTEDEINLVLQWIEEGARNN